MPLIRPESGSPLQLSVAVLIRGEAWGTPSGAGGPERKARPANGRAAGAGAG
jgi:hypothetical protein